MKNIFVLSVAVLLLAFAGCFTEREAGQGNRALLKGGQAVAADMDGWVAVPNTSPAITKSGDLNYAVLAANNVTTPAMDGWVALNPACFAKLTGIAVLTPTAAPAEVYVLKEGRDIPKAKTGWVAVPNSQPAIETSTRIAILSLATLAGNQIVPKEINGWVAVDTATLAKLVEKAIDTGAGAEVPVPHKDQ